MDPDRGGGIPPLIVFGAEPTGILLLANYLGLHTHLEPVYDTGFVADVVKLAGRLDSDESEEAKAAVRESVEQWRAAFWDDRSVGLQLPFGQGHVTFLQELPAATDRLLAAAGDPLRAVRAFLEELFAVQLGWAQKRAYVNASRRYVEVLPELASVFPDGVFLHVLRDGRGAAHEAAPTEAPELGLEFERAGEARVVRTRYEDLLERPADELSRLCGELGLPDEGEKIVLIYENAFPLPQGTADSGATDAA